MGHGNKSTTPLPPPPGSKGKGFCAVDFSRVNEGVTHFSPTESSPRGSRRFFLLDSVTLKPSGNQSCPCSLRRLRDAKTPTPTVSRKKRADATKYMGYQGVPPGGSAISPAKQKKNRGHTEHRELSCISSQRQKQNEAKLVNKGLSGLSNSTPSQLLQSPLGGKKGIFFCCSSELQTHGRLCYCAGEESSPSFLL